MLRAFGFFFGCSNTESDQVSENKFIQNHSAKYVLVGGVASYTKDLLDSYLNNADFKVGDIIIGLELRTKNIVDKNIGNLSISYYFPGNQERFRTIARAYYRKTNCFILVVNMADESLRESEYWIHDFKAHSKHGEDIPKVVIGHYDANTTKKITAKMIDKFSKEHGIEYQHIVDRGDKEHIRRVFDDINNQYIKDYCEVLNRKAKYSQDESTHFSPMMSR